MTAVAAVVKPDEGRAA